MRLAFISLIFRNLRAISLTTSARCIIVLVSLESTLGVITLWGVMKTVTLATVL